MSFNLTMAGHRAAVQEGIDRDDFGGDKSGALIKEFAQQFIDTLPSGGVSVSISGHTNTRTGYVEIKIRGHELLLDADKGDQPT